MSDYYKILGVSKKASSDDIKKAYRGLAKKYHPDKNPTGTDEEKFKEISEAYGVLADPLQRQKYDQFGTAKVPPQPRHSNVNDIFESFGFDGMFNSFFGGGHQRAPRGRDFLVDLSISFEEAVHGCIKPIVIHNSQHCDACGATGAPPGASPVNCGTCQGIGRVEMRQGFFSVSTTCAACGGVGKVIEEKCPCCAGQGIIDGEETLSVKLPPGINSGGKIRVYEKGELGPGGPGDLLVRIHVLPHSLYERHGRDIYSTVSLNIVEASMGCQKNIDTLHGTKVVSFRPGTQPDHKLRLKGMGAPSLKKNKMGNHILRVNIEIPTNLSPKQKALFSELETTL